MNLDLSPNTGTYVSCLKRPIRSSPRRPRVRANATWSRSSRLWRANSILNRSRFIAVDPSSRIERDLGIDSLGRTELILRIERAFRVRLPTQTIGEAETIHDLAQGLDRAAPVQERLGLEMPVPALPSVPAATKAQTLVEVLEWHVALHPDRMHSDRVAGRGNDLRRADIL
jgi:acyl carrier protein